jgi:type IV pilus assembly protein PilW
MNQQRGFTLIELMVSIVLGLLISAAAVQLLIAGQTMLATQQAGGDVQDNGVFGLDVLARGIRLANYNNSSSYMTDQTPWGGIILTSDPTGSTVTGNLEGMLLNAAVVPDGLLSRSNTQDLASTNNHWKGLSNVKLSTGSSVQSDQLVIQYQAPQDMYDCEGKFVNGPRDILSLTYDQAKGEKPVAAAVGEGEAVGGDYVIERYYLRADAISSTNEPNTALALACDSGRYVRHNATTTAISDFGDAGQIIMNRVDHFHFLLGIMNDAQQLSYVTAKQYADITGVRPRIKSVQVAMLVRSMNSSQNALVDSTVTTYTMLDQVVKAKTTSNDRYLRKVYTATSSLRNGFGDKPL